MEDILSERLNWKQACEILGCAKSSLYRMVRKGCLPMYGIGARNRWFLRTDCERQLKKHKTPLTITSL